MTSTNRLRLAGIMIVASALYAVLVAMDRQLARDIAIGYTVALLSSFAVVNMWKRP